MVRNYETKSVGAITEGRLKIVISVSTLIIQFVASEGVKDLLH